MKNKKESRRLNMKDLVNELQTNEKPVVDNSAKYADEFSFISEEHADKLKKYNEELNNINPVYGNLIPFTKILVRVMVKELEKTEGGLYMPNMLEVPIPTQSGLGHVEQAENPWPYTRSAIVVAVPESFKNSTFVSLSILDKVILSSSPVKGHAMSKGRGAAIGIANSFTHPLEYKNNQPPTDPSNPHYGYLLVSMSELEMKL